MITSKILAGMVCTILLLTTLIISGCVETVETAKQKEIVDRFGKLVFVKPDVDDKNTFYLSIIDQDGIIYYPVYLNKNFTNLVDIIVPVILQNNISDVNIVFSADRIKNFDTGDKIGSPIDLTFLDMVITLSDNNTKKEQEQIFFVIDTVEKVVNG